MKRFILMLYCLLVCIFASAQSSVRVLTGHSSINETLDINKVFSQDTVLAPFNTIMNVSGISVDATVIHDSGVNYLVRILLQDETGTNYLVAESYREICDTDTIIFDNYGIETSLLNSIQPKFIKIIIKNALINIKNVNIVLNSALNGRNVIKYSQAEQDSIRYKQIEDLVRNINDYNIKNNKLWWAGVTPLSLMGYEERKRILGITDDSETGGLEYYQGGIFEVGEPTSGTPATRNVSPYINHFDWRTRHGKNWLTPAKDQGKSGYCVAFAVTSATEAMVNLYYNKMINLDLSEQNIGACVGTNPHTYKHGMSYLSGLNYIKNYGVFDEASYPFVDDSTAQCRSDEITPQQHVKIAGYSLIGTSADDGIKQALIQKGPLVSGMNTLSPGNNYPINHAMTLVGYKVIEAGDSIWEIVEYDPTLHSYGLREQFVIKEGDSRVGMTCWIFKDNYPKSHTYEGGYMYLLFHNPTFLNETYSLQYPFSIMNYTDDDIICEDADGDGYYFWGLGSKPDSCPSWVPNTPDGDDSNASYGPMNGYGYLENLQPDTRDTIFITSNETDSMYGYIYNHICVKNGATLNVANTKIVHNGASITIHSGASLIVDGGVLENASVNLLNGSNLTIKNGGSIKPVDGSSFVVPAGVEAEISYGSIIP